MTDSRIGQFVWYDLMTSEPEAAQRFYTAVVGWGTRIWEGPKPYTMWVNGESPVGGVMDLPEQAREMGAPPHWLAYVHTSDVGATLKRAQGLGGRVLVEPQEIPSIGSFAIMADPQGAVIALFAPEGDSPGPAGPPKVGEASWHELVTTDHKAAFAFYSELFGWEKTDSMDIGPQVVYQMYGQQGRTYGGMFNKPAEMPGPSAWLVYFRVADLDKAVEVATSSGAKLMNGPMEVPGGDRIAQLMDPQGVAFALHERKA